MTEGVGEVTVDQALLHLRLETRGLPRSVVDALHVIERELMALQKSEQLAEAMVEKLLAKERASDGRDASEVP